MLDNNKLTIGSDPEFTLYRQVGDRLALVRAVDKFREYKLRRGASLTQMKFGTDGAISTMEIRPEPANDPIEHAENIKKLLKQARKNYPSFFDLIFKSVSKDLPVGGHVHFGHPFFRSSASEGSKIVRDLGHNLDLLLSFPTLFIEKHDEAIYRRLRYGSLSDIRLQPYGGYEYRTLPSWLASERVTRAILTTAFSVAYDTIENDLKLPEKVNMEGQFFSRAFMAHETRILRPHLFPFYRVIKNLTLYPKYRADIDYLINSSRNGRLLLGTDIRKGWGFKITRRVVRLMNLIRYYQKASKEAMKYQQVTQIREAQHRTSYESSDLFLQTNGKNQLRIEELARSVSISLFLANKKVFETQPEINGVMVYGIHKNKNLDISIKCPFLDGTRRRRVRRFLFIAEKLAQSEGGERVKFDIKYGRISLGFGYKIRKENYHLCQSLAILYFLLNNPQLWKATNKGKTTPIRIKDLINSYAVIKKQVEDKERKTRICAV